MTQELNDHDERRQRALFNEVRHELLSALYIEFRRRNFSPSKVKEVMLAALGQLDPLDRDALLEMERRASETYKEIMEWTPPPKTHLKGS